MSHPEIPPYIEIHRNELGNVVYQALLATLRTAVESAFDRAAARGQTISVARAQQLALATLDRTIGDLSAGHPFREPLQRYINAQMPMIARHFADGSPLRDTNN